MSQPSLHGTKLKLERAKRHVSELEAGISAFHQGNPYQIVREHDTKGRRYVYSVNVVKEVPACLSAIIGDALHNLRSALDHLAWELIIANHKQPTRRTGFPIGDNRQSFETDAAGKIKGIGAKAARIIHRLKPYKTGRKPFWLIHELNRLDKHKAIVPVGAAYKHVTLNVRLPPEWQTVDRKVSSISILPADRSYPLKNGTKLFLCPENFFDTNDEPDFTFEVAFGEGQIVDGEPVIPTLNNLVQFVEKVVRIFERRLNP